MGAVKTLIFTYGTLKRGFGNHWLVDELTKRGDVEYRGVCQTAEKYPLVCGPYNVPFLINEPGHGHRIYGELYAVSEYGLGRMDELEGTGRGHYVRRPVLLRSGSEPEVEVRAEAYFADESYGGELWRRWGRVGLPLYSESEAEGYVRRGARPQGVTFLEAVHAFIKEEAGVH
ncbi:hypothetical protein AMTRI_Chr03g52830 [Amborella trichopoda]|uniref:Gamma-glutamylcyclotransferase family protein n=1 Tax=Amborella trichopoda TaxID=13333 RepID=W1P2I7_AMBTC|nr:putative gamma-glutamylcyclotransferase At3g02910 [Amborella trichopoda]ERN01155.1 hypothetical protein AMTR_s00002p00218040 [Amborella trichopoda]|eukprot:XP_006838586.1 putative gamma-glutamylcyclotransferase At3g02910 [Amborella trichopoda]